MKPSRRKLLSSPGARRTAAVSAAALAVVAVIAGASLATASESSDSTSTTSASTTDWPDATADVEVEETIEVDGTFDGELQRYAGVSDGDQEEGQDPIFEIADGGTIKNVIIGAPGADGIHCLGSCTIENVWWEDVGEDAATLLGSDADQVMTVTGGGAKNADDKVFQHNGPGTMNISDFEVDDFGKLYRSCGNCSSQYQRTVNLSNITAIAPGKTLVGINTNYGDVATFSNIVIEGDDDMPVCTEYTGNDDGDEPEKIGTGEDDGYCVYDDSDITYE